MPVHFDEPRGLLLLLGIIPLVVLYILKIRRRRHSVGSTWLWASARRDLLARSPFRRFVAELSFFLQLFALVMLALALARPSRRTSEVLGEHAAIVIDTSASMKAIDPKTGRARIELAKDAAKRYTRGLAPGGDAMVVDAGREPHVVLPPERDRRRIEAAIDAIEASDEEGDLDASLAIAADRLRSAGGDHRLLLVTDGSLARKDVSALPVPLTVETVGEDVENAGLIRLDVRTGRGAAATDDEVQVFVVARHDGRAPREAWVTLRLASTTEPIASRKVTLTPGARVPVVLSFKPSPGDQGKPAIVELTPHDALETDDFAYLRVPEGRKQEVVVVAGDPSPWLERALRSDEDVEIVRVARLADAKPAPGALFVFDGTCPAEAPPGDFLVVAPPEGRCLGAQVGPAEERPPVTSWSHGDPRFRFLTMDDVHVAVARRIIAESASRALVRSTDFALVADVSDEAAGSSGTLVGFDVADSNWPLKASFVIFVRNVVELARAHRVQGSTSAPHTGAPLRVPLPRDATRVQVHVPGSRPGEGRGAPVQGGALVFADTRRAGHYVVSYQGPHARSLVVPVNLTSELESALLPRVRLESHAAPTTDDATQRPPHRDVGYWFAALALLAIVVEVVWWTRTPRRTAPTAPPRPDRRPT